ncbi:MAG: F0F1 ATP synthase subunit beta, partial [Tepidiformaceae bacterium]
MVMAPAAEGRVVQIIGTVIDIEFPPDRLPALNNAVNIQLDDGTELVTEVQQHLGNNWVRCLAMDSTDGLRRDTKAIDTGVAIAVPVGEQSLGRMFNVLGHPIDNLPAAEGLRWPIHRLPPSFEEL